MMDFAALYPSLRLFSAQPLMAGRISGNAMFTHELSKNDSRAKSSADVASTDSLKTASNKANINLSVWANLKLDG